MERKLASIRKVTKIESIPEADLVECVSLDGWDLVSKKGDFQDGDLGVYFEIDSILPRKPWNEFLFKTVSETNYRLKTKKLRGVISQGLLIPIKNITEITNPIFEGDDLTEFLGITKYEPQIPAQLQGIVKGNFPEGIRKSDEERWQNIPKIWDELLLCEEIVGRRKEDGSSATFYLIDDVFGVCSRNLDLKESENNTFWKVARKLDIENKLRMYLEYINSILNQTENPIIIKNIYCQGELLGPGIQKNLLGLAENTVHLFDFGYPNTNLKNTDYDLIHFCDMTNLDICPEVFRGKIGDKFKSLEEMSEFSDTITYPNGKTAEGIVWRRLDWGYSPYLKSRLSFKTISNKYLLKNE